MKIVAVINARMTSRRLPGKSLLLLKGRTSLYHHVSRFQSMKEISEIWLATTKSRDDDRLVEESRRLGIPAYRGEEEDIVERYVTIGKKAGADVMVRCGCDKPLFSREALKQMIGQYRSEDYFFIDGNTPVGFKTELVSARGMIETHKHYRGTAITQYIREHPHKFSVNNIKPDPLFLRSEYRIALDTEEDYAVLTKIFNALYKDSPIELREVFRFLDDNPAIANLNRNVSTMPVNTYVEDLIKKPVATVYDESGRLVFRDRMGDPISNEDAILLIDKIKAGLNGKK